MIALRIILIGSIVILTNAQLPNVKKIDKPKQALLEKFNHDSARLNRKRRHYYGSCREIKTWNTIDGNVNTVYLDRQSPDCGLTAMRSFQLVRNVVYLDRQFVSCPHSGFIKHFHLNRQLPSKYRYTYSCCTPESSQQHKMNCYDSNTPSGPDGSWNMAYLDKLRPTCRLGYFLSNFKLVRPTLSTMRYNYRCCAFLPQ